MDQEEIDRQFQQYVQSWIQKKGKTILYVGRDVTASHQKDVRQIHDTMPKMDYNWFSDHQMYMMDKHPFEPGCPVQLLTITIEDFFQCPLMRQAYHLMNSLLNHELTLTSEDYLPANMVEELYEKGARDTPRLFINEFTERNVDDVRLVHIVLEGTGIVTINSGVMTLSDKGRALLEDQNFLVRTILTFLFMDFDTSSWDLRGEAQSGNKLRLYSLWLLHHFGEGWQGFQFYEKEYFKAFPSKASSRTYSNRFLKPNSNNTLKRLFIYLGVCETIAHFGDPFIRKSPLLEKMFSFEEPSKK